MFKATLQKPDGRMLTLYSRHPISDIGPCFSMGEPLKATPHLRWNPLRREWIIYAKHRQSRTFLPPKEYNPLAPSSDREHPTELPTGRYDVAVFDNLFPSLASSDSSRMPESYEVVGVPARPASGKCEVIVFSQDSTTSLGAMSLSEIELVLDVWADRMEELKRNAEVKYALPFENRGVEMGVTLNHPHGQIYGYPFIPRDIELMSGQFAIHFDQHRISLLETMLKHEKRDRRRLIHETNTTTAFIPICARLPYEVWVIPNRRVGLLTELNREERHDFAMSLKTVLMKYDKLWNKPLPYLMAIYQAPLVDGAEITGFHLHFEFMPILRTKDKLKYLAGTELGAGVFANDAFPEESARELQLVELDPRDFEA